MNKLIERVRCFLFPARIQLRSRQSEIKAVLDDIKHQTSAIASSASEIRATEDPIYSLAIKMRKAKGGSHESV